VKHTTISILIIGILFAVTFQAISSCATVPKFNPADGKFSKETETIACWNVSDYLDSIFVSLKMHGKLKIEMVKEKNAVTNWVLGAGMCLGGLFIFGGIVWLVYNLAYMGGKYTKSGILAITTGLLVFGCAYLLMEYLWVLLCVVGVGFVGSIVWLIWYMKENKKVVEAGVRSVEIAKHSGMGEDIRTELRSVQGNHQSFYKKMHDRLYPDG